MTIDLEGFLGEHGFKKIKLAMDFEHINRGLACKGCDPVDAILGVDVFEGQSAVIDYDSLSLFLKE